MSTAFDDLAFGYDSSYTQTALGSRLRELVWERCDVLFRPGDAVLDLGCGTGEDAIRLARAGLRVVALDSAEQMLRVARAKAARARDERVEFHCSRMETAPQIFASRKFDGVLSNFGAVNCVSDLPMLSRGLADICRPGAHLLWVVMGRYAPWEWAWYAARGQPRKAIRRLAANGVAWRGLRIRYPTPRDLSAMLRPLFSITRVAPLGFFLPPSYAGEWLERSPRTLGLLTAMERRAQRSRVLAAYADHFIIEATRV